MPKDSNKPSKATANQPFLPFFVGDFFAATIQWEDGEAISLYATLLLHQWAGGSIPSEPKRICKLVKWDWELFEKHWPIVRRKFQTFELPREDGTLEDRLVNVRLEEHRDKTVELSAKNSESGRKGAEARWGKRPKTDSEGMADGSGSDGERHIERVANAIKTDGETDGAKMANATKNDGIHPIPSHPIPSDPIPDSHSESLLRIPTSSGQREDAPTDAEIAKSDSEMGGDNPSSDEKSRDSQNPADTNAGDDRKSAARGTRIPIPFQVPADLLAWAAKEHPRVNLTAVTVEFEDYWVGVPGWRGRKLDWLATWRNRVRVVADRMARLPNNAKHIGPSEKEILDKLMNRRGAMGIPTFRDPLQGEKADHYRAAQDEAWYASHEARRNERSIGALAAAALGSKVGAGTVQ